MTVQKAVSIIYILLFPVMQRSKNQKKRTDSIKSENMINAHISQPALLKERKMQEEAKEKQKDLTKPKRYKKLRNERCVNTTAIIKGKVKTMSIPTIDTLPVNRMGIKEKIFSEALKDKQIPRQKPRIQNIARKKV